MTFPDYEAARHRMAWHAEKGHWKTWLLDELTDDIVDVALGDRVLYEVKDISTCQSFVDGGMLAIDAVHGSHQGVLVQVWPKDALTEEDNDDE